MPTEAPPSNEPALVVDTIGRRTQARELAARLRELYRRNSELWGR
jgi:hypothetical protein